MADNDYKKDVAEYLRTQNNMPLDASDDELIEFARETDPKEFERLTAMAYGNQPKDDQVSGMSADYAAQHPVQEFVQNMGDVAKAAVPFNPMTYVGKTFASISDFIQPPFEQARKEHPVASRAALGGLVGGLQDVSDIGKGLGQAGRSLVGAADLEAEQGNLGKASVLAGLGGMAQMAPQSEADALLSVVPFEQGIAPASKGVLKGISSLKTGKIGSALDSLAAYFPGSAIVRDAALAKKSSVIESSKFKKLVAGSNDELAAIKYKIDGLEAGMKSIPDSIEYGKFAKKGLEFQEELAKAPLIERVRKLNDLPEVKVVSTVSDIGDEVAVLRDELSGVVETSKDAVVTKIADKYLGKEIVQEGPAIAFDFKKNAFRKRTKDEMKSLVFADASVADLIKDRSRVGEAYMRARREGALDTVQSATLLKLQDAIDNGIERRLAKNPEALAEVKNIRGGWKQFYNKYASDTAIAVKKSADSEVLDKIGKTASAVEEARQILPTSAFEKMADNNHKLLVRDMSGSKNPEQFLMKQLQDNPGYWERLLGQNQVSQIQTLAKSKVDLANIQGQLNDLGEKLKLSESNTRRMKDSPFLANLKRETDKQGMAKVYGSAGKALGAAITAQLAFHNPTVTTVIAALGLVPGPVAYAYYTAGRSVRVGIEKSLSNAAKLGKAVNRADVAFLQSVSLAGERALEQKAVNPDFKPNFNLGSKQPAVLPKKAGLKDLVNPMAVEPQEITFGVDAIPPETEYESPVD